MNYYIIQYSTNEQNKRLETCGKHHSVFVLSDEQSTTFWNLYTNGNKNESFSNSDGKFCYDGFYSKSATSQIIDILFCIVDAVFVGLYIVFEASGIEVFMESIFSLTVEVGITIAYISIIFKNDELFITVECFENELYNSMDFHKEW